MTLEAQTRGCRNLPLVVSFGPYLIGIASCDQQAIYGDVRRIEACPPATHSMEAETAIDVISYSEYAMSEDKNAESLARTWLEYWNEGTPDDIPLAENFKHTSPFGCVEGRQKYLDWVKPLSARNTVDLKIQRIISDRNQAVVHFEMETPSGKIPVVDWIVVSGDEIVEIQSFYDATKLHQ